MPVNPFLPNPLSLVAPGLVHEEDRPEDFEAPAEVEQDVQETETDNTLGQTTVTELVNAQLGLTGATGPAEGATGETPPGPTGQEPGATGTTGPTGVPADPLGAGHTGVPKISDLDGAGNPLTAPTPPVVQNGDAGPRVDAEQEEQKRLAAEAEAKKQADLAAAAKAATNPQTNKGRNGK